MRIAAFSDVHANLEALEAALTDMERRQVDRVICLGDLVGYGASPNEVIQVIRERGIPTVMGNYDDAVGYDRGECGCAYTGPQEKTEGHELLLQSRSVVTVANKAYLRTLPFRIDQQVHGLKITFVHGSPRRLNEYLYDERPSSAFDRVLEFAGADILVCGHTHAPFHRVLGKRHVVNVGAVGGRPRTFEAQASYAILDLSDGVKVEFRVLDLKRPAVEMRVAPAACNP
jgi:putative phosphoesterase